ncbi:TetR/AcrR family transcriptional regulator [Nocardia otitidiscaviarum]|uniref:TetR/AcrR family transcriptional regulator n=1 Tax=Nocardia otitidiscaviarum TaxID=1823 RepID=UPI0004A73C03|nr:TetR/AcrR family transcriptional regulator [Nocardia otitidiscaviarum]MBF6132530.1 TetR/AcrR family transcriptional regulator [Nocardia otitidiscaviarum]MBF6488631.1 TetR/AcrR family transcriptional regulator [Nocardia otitidiscaviarum]
MRRTQQERREATIAKLFDAAIATLDELGYARASANTVTARAGMSYGALFRHFPTMSEFMAAVAREAVRRNTELVTRRVRELADASGGTDIETLLRVLHELTDNPTHHAILELTTAARTDEQLRDAMRHSMTDVGTLMIDTAARIVGPDFDLDAQDFATLVFILVDLFDSEAIQHPLRAPYPEIYERRIPLLVHMLKSFTSRTDSVADSRWR